MMMSVPNRKTESSVPQKKKNIYRHSTPKVEAYYKIRVVLAARLGNVLQQGRHHKMLPIM